MRYYLYRHIRKDKNVPFYIGVGTKNKRRTISSCYSRAYNLTGRNKIHTNIVSKTDIEIEIIYESDNLQDIFNKEIEFIALYGRINLNSGTLANLTSGGEGGGQGWSEEVMNEAKRKRRENGTNAANGKRIGADTASGKIKPYDRRGSGNPKYKGPVGKFKNGVFIKQYPMAKDVVEDGYTPNNVSLALNGKLKTSGGFEWKYLT